MNALVTAIIPAYNYARFLPRAIDSVLAQTYTQIECLVVDDGSTDDTAEVLAGYGDRIRTIRQTNSGLSAARNTGISFAQGEYVALLDSDDWWAPEKIARQVACLESDPTLAAVGCGYGEFGPDLRIIATHITPQPGPSRVENLRAVAIRQLWVGGSGSGLLAKRSVIEDLGGFDTTLRAAEDWDLWLRLFAGYKVANIPDVLVSIHMHGTGSFRNSALMEENQSRVVEAALQRWPDELRGLIVRQMRALVLADAANELILAGDLVRARKKMWNALVAWPFSRRRIRVILSLGAKTARASILGHAPKPNDRSEV